MYFGVIAGPAWPPPAEMTVGVAFENMTRIVDAAVASGFDGIGLSHKYLSAPDHQFFQPLILAPYIFAQYPEIYVQTNVFLLPYHNPVAVAEQVATLDAIAPGRFLFGVGQGYRENERMAFNIDHKARGRMVEESIMAIRRLWAGEGADFQGEFWKFKGAELSARPKDGVGPPILLAADTVRSVRRVPSRGADAWLPSPRHSTVFLREAIAAYREELERLNLPFRGLPMTRDLAVAPSVKEAESLVRDSISDYLHRQHGWGQPGEAYDVGFDELKQDRLILGPPQKVAEELLTLHHKYHARIVTFRMYTPGMSVDRVLEMIQDVGENVLPLVRREVGREWLFATRDSTLHTNGGDRER